MAGVMWLVASWVIAQTQLPSELERLRQKHGVPAIAVAVIRGGHITDSAVAGVRVSGSSAAVSMTDRFDLASCTKSMTAMLVAIAVERGHVRWDSRLDQVLPELARDLRGEYRAATLEQLLSHRAQYPAYTQFGPARLEQLKRLSGSATAQRLAFLREVLRSDPPNTGLGDAAYSNVGYTAAAAMLEGATGLSWEQLIERWIARPLGLSSLTFVWPATTSRPNQPRGHYMRDGRLVPQPIDDSYILPVALAPAGAVTMSITDFARYAADHLNGLGGRPALLKRETYQRLHRTMNGDSAGFTLGWGVRQDAELGTVHFGAGSGGTFFARVWIVPGKDLAMVALANAGDAGAAATRELFTAISSPALRGR